jgi:hypothetical protein
VLELPFWILLVSLLFMPSAEAMQIDKRPTPSKIETVMVPGMRITATTSTGTIAITAVDDLTRSYTWEGATRSVEMDPRTERWYGSLGLYFPGPSDHWQEHNGITRGVLEEGQQHFKTTQEALHWIRSRWIPYVYRDDGLVVGWNKTLPRKQLNVEVWQLYVNGKKPQQLPGSQNKQITITYVQTESSLLVKAVVQNDVKAVQALLNRGDSPNTKDSIGVPVLVFAVRRGYTAVAKALLDKGADPGVRSPEGSTALLEVAYTGPVDLVQRLLAKGADVNATYQKGIKQGMTPLIIAVMSGNAAIVAALLENGADVNAKAAFGATALRIAAMEKHQDIVRLLKQAGAKE